jgi:hypothetical protein
MTRLLALDGLHVIPNDGGTANNCLIISLVQALTGKFSHPHDTTVAQIRNALIRQFPELDLDSPLHSDGHRAQWLLAHVQSVLGLPAARAVIMPSISGPKPRLERPRTTRVWQLATQQLRAADVGCAPAPSG